MIENDITERAERPNKSLLKRQIAERSALVEQMTALTDAELRRIGVEDFVIEQVAEVRAIAPSGARNRQLKYAVKRLDDADLAIVKTYLNNRQSQQLAVNQAFHLLENWRTRLIEQGDAALGEALAVWPQIDRQQIRQLIRDARRERDVGKPAGAARKLFRYLRELGEPGGQA